MHSSRLAALIILTAALPALPADGLVAHWPMDEAPDGVVLDATGNGHDATYAAKDESPPEFVPGIAGNAIKLSEDKEAYLAVPWAEALSFTGPFTVMAWVKPTRRNATFEVLCFKGDRSGDPPWPGWRLRFFWTRAMLQVGTPEGEEPRVTSPEWSVPAGFWSHIAAGWDGEHLRVYVNAVEQGSEPFDGAIAPQHHWRPLVLGNYIGRKNAYAFDGLLDELKVFDRFLDEEEVFEEALRGMDEGR